MVFPGMIRRALKLVPTILQALALVVFIHVVGQVSMHDEVGGDVDHYLAGAAHQVWKCKIQIQQKLPNIGTRLWIK